MEKEKVEKSLKEAKSKVEKKGKEVLEDVNLFIELPAAEKKDKIEKAVKNTENKAKKMVLGDDEKFDASDLKRIANGGLEIVAGICGGLEHGFGWFRKKIEEGKLK